MSEVVETKQTRVMLIQINYKSGISLTSWFEKFEMKHNAGKVVELDYLTAYNEYPRPVLIGDLSSIESVYMIDTKVIDEPV